METSSLIQSENQWAGFYMIGVFVMKELEESQASHHLMKFLRNFSWDEGTLVELINTNSPCRILGNAKGRANFFIFIFRKVHF